MKRKSQTKVKLQAWVHIWSSGIQIVQYLYNQIPQNNDEKNVKSGLVLLGESVSNPFAKHLLEKSKPMAVWKKILIKAKFYQI